MPGIFSRINKARDARQKKKNALNDLENSLPTKPKWDDAYTRPSVEPDEIEDLIKCCSEEIKARGLDHPFLLLPFRPTSDPSGVRTFIRNFFDNNPGLSGEPLTQELRMAEPMVLAGIIKWCWSRLQGGVVSWDAYELFKVGEYDSRMDRDAFKTFIPLSVDSDARQNIIFSFFDLMAAIAAHANTNGFGGRKLSRMAAWWAFEHKETSNGFDGGYKAWAKAADATTHLFFAYLRSQTPELGLGGISMIPRSLEKLLREVEYPPQPSNLLVTKTNKLVMIVDSVSPTPFALLRRAGHFQYRDSDMTLQQFSQYEDPVSALTEECVRVLKAISAANQSQVSSAKHSTSLRDASWSRFEDIGFSSALNEETEDSNDFLKPKAPMGLKSTPASGNNDLGRPTTPSWADFLSAGFNDENAMKSNVLLPPDKVLPPIDTETRQRSSQSHHPRLESDQRLEPGELASITTLALDDAFWWVWMNSLAPEETPVRKSAFGRCAVVETKIGNGQWLVLEEVVTGAAPEPEDGAYIAEKKGFFSWTKRSKTISRRKSVSAKKREQLAAGDSKTSIDTETQAKIHAKAVQLRAIQEQDTQNNEAAQRRGRNDSDLMSEKTNSVFALQPQIAGEATSALKWVKKYDKGAVKDAYLANDEAGRGHSLPQSTSNLLDYSTGQTHQTVAADANAAADATSHETSQPHEAPASLSTEPVARNEHESDLINGPQQAEDSSPAPPPKDETPVAAPAQPLTPSRSSAGMQQRFNQAKEAKEKGPLRKLFSRKNRSSKVPDSYSADLNKMLEEHESKTEKSAATSTAGEDAQTAENNTSVEHSAAATEEPETATVSPKVDSGENASYAEPTLNDDNLAQPEVSPVEKQSGSFGHQSSHVDTEDASEAKKEFSRFDQGPLVEQPAFVPESDDNDVEGAPATNQKTRSEGNGTASRAKDELSQSAGPGVQDRWAQIRKNAANRAAQRQVDDRSHTVASKTSDGDDDTSGEETIESRVARIKARVAELTGNMEGTSSPSPPAVNRS